MKDGKQNINYSAKDIARYHNGQMSPAEMHALEKAALDDPFLADAIEGFAYSKAPEPELASLRKKLEERTNKKRAGVFTMPQRSSVLRIAALFILLAGVGWLVVKMASDDQHKDLATIPEEKPLQQPVETTRADTGSLKVTNPVTETSTAARTSASYSDSHNRDIIAGKTKSQTLPAERNSAAFKKPQAGSGSVTNETATAAISKNEEAVKEQIVTESVQYDRVNAPPATDKKVANGFVMNHEIKGVVKNDDGKPVPYASIKVRGVNKSSVADGFGYFSIKSSDSTAVVTASAVGFESETATLKNRSDNLIVLNENKDALNEVVVTGTTQGRKKAPSKYIVTSGELEPEEGWVLYNEYVEARLRNASDEKLKESENNREVALAFDVNTDGEPINITVVKSQCPECNDTAIKLLKEGPKWKSRKGKKGKISFKF